MASTLSSLFRLFATHNAFVMFGYGFSDIKALTAMHFYWLVIPIMSGVSASLHASSACFPVTIYHEHSFLCWAGLLCVPNIHIVKVTNRPDTRHLDVFLCPLSISV